MNNTRAHLTSNELSMLPPVHTAATYTTDDRTMANGKQPRHTRTRTDTHTTDLLALDLLFELRMMQHGGHCSHAASCTHTATTITIDHGHTQRSVTATSQAKNDLQTPMQ